MAKRTTRTTNEGTSTKETSTPSKESSPYPSTAEDRSSATMEPDTRNAPMSSGANARNESMASEPSEEEIRIRAYRRYLERGRSDGRDFDDWLEAEMELKRVR